MEDDLLAQNTLYFGEVIDGMDVVTAIERCNTRPGDRPVDPQQIISVTRA